MSSSVPVQRPSIHTANSNGRVMSSRVSPTIAVHRTSNSITAAPQVYVTHQGPMAPSAPARPPIQRGTPFQTTAAFTVQAGTSPKYTLLPSVGSQQRQSIRTTTSNNATSVVIMPQVPQYITPHHTPSFAGPPPMNTIPPTIQRIRGEFMDPSGRRSAPPSALTFRPPPTRASSSVTADSDTEYNSAFNALPSSLTYPEIAPRVSPTSTGMIVRPPIRKRTTSSNSSVHFSPDTFMVTMPTSQTLKISNIPRYGTNSLMRAIKEKVITMWLPGIASQREGRGEYIVEFAGLIDGAAEPRRHGYENGLTEADRKNWGIWTARGVEGIIALRLLSTLFAVLASHGFSYLAELHCLPPQLIFSTTPTDFESRFFCVELCVTPLARRKQKVSVLDDDGQVIERRKVKLDIARVGIRCVDIPPDVLKAVVGAVRNTGREGAGLYTGSKPGGYESSGDEDIRGQPEILEFGVQGEKWDAKGVYMIDSVISRGTGRRTAGRREYAEFPGRRSGSTQIIEADTDTLPVLLSHLLKALSSHGFRLESSVPLPLPVPLADPLIPFGHHPRAGGFASFLENCFGGDEGAQGSRGHGREAWVFRSVDWFNERGS